MLKYAKRYIPTIYEFYCSYIKKNGYCPSYRTVSREAAINICYISNAIHWLIDNGYMKELKKGIYMPTDKEFKGVE